MKKTIYIKLFAIMFFSITLLFSNIYFGYSTTTQRNNNNYNENEGLHLLNFLGIKIDFSKIFNFIFFWRNDKKENYNNDNNNIHNKYSNSDNNKINTNKNSNYHNKNYEKKSKTLNSVNSFNFKLGNYTFNNVSLKNKINSKQEFSKYIIKFDYDCIGVRSNPNTEITLFFDTKNGKVKSIKNGIKCERQISIKSELINDIKKNGFKISKIKSYLKYIDLETGMYFKAIKVFTIG